MKYEPSDQNYDSFGQNVDFWNSVYRQWNASSALHQYKKSSKH